MNELNLSIPILELWDAVVSRFDLHHGKALGYSYFDATDCLHWPYTPLFYDVWFHRFANILNTKLPEQLKN